MNKKYSLKKNEDIAKLVQMQKSVGNKYYAIYYQENAESTPKIAISISRKFGKAVKRNYEKRVVREIIRALLPILEGYTILVVIKKEVANITFIEKKTQIEYLIKKMKSRS